MAKKKKAKAPKVDSKEALRKYIAKATELFAVHGVVIIFIVAGATIGMALVRARAYLEPARDENRYTEESAKNNYSKIDYKLVEKLENSLVKAPVDVNQNVDPNRNNPFSE
jgi:hypothetical protein